MKDDGIGDSLFARLTGKRKFFSRGAFGDESGDEDQGDREQARAERKSVGERLREFVRDVEESVDPVRAKRRRYENEREDQPGRELERATGGRRKASGDYSFMERGGDGKRRSSFDEMLRRAAKEDELAAAEAEGGRRIEAERKSGMGDKLKRRGIKYPGGFLDYDKGADK